MRREVATFLGLHGFRVVEAGDVATALAHWGGQRPDLVILDLGLPDADGSVVIRRVRRDAATPIVVLSVRDREDAKVAALEQGADDFVTKPFGAAELLARLRAVLRRAAGPAADPGGLIRLGALEVDVAAPPGDRPRPTGPPDAAGVRGPQGPRHARRPTRHARPTAPRSVGDGLRRRGALRPRLRQPDPAQGGCRGSSRRACAAHRGGAWRRVSRPPAGTRRILSDP